MYFWGHVQKVQDMGTGFLSTKFYGKIFIINSIKLEIIGTDIEIIIILLPSSILLAIAPSPESLQMLTANSARKAIPVIFTSKLINFMFIADLSAIVLIRVTIPC